MQFNRRTPLFLCFLFAVSIKKKNRTIKNPKIFFCKKNFFLIIICIFLFALKSKKGKKNIEQNGNNGNKRNKGDKLEGGGVDGTRSRV